MTETRMFGVVLWTDTTGLRAVIWCEDHGDLAYYNGPDAEQEDPASALTGAPLDAGDLVQVDVRRTGAHRAAHNPQPVQRGYSRGLAEKLLAFDGRRAEHCPRLGRTVVRLS